jgi:manganese transport protein
VAAIIIALNVKLVVEEAIQLLRTYPSAWIYAMVVVAGLGIVFLLGITILYPLLRAPKDLHFDIHSAQNLANLPGTAGFSTIAIAFDYSSRDTQMLQYALQLARADTRFVLIHVVESAAARRIGEDTDDLETLQDREQLNQYAAFFRDRQFEVIAKLGYKYRVQEIARIVKEEGAELLIVGSHGHRLLSDWLFGETINSVRHLVQIPVFIVR